ncbi:ABC transporter ATP-binding protein [bacterium]|nr:ABC transporter ATP-binding protein [bacterium]
MARTADGPAISAAALTMRFGSFTAVQDVSFDVSPGEIFGFLGPNGSGKSTVIRMLCGLLRPTEGSGHILGMDSSREAESVKRSIGYMSQKFSLYPDLTVHENLSFYGRIYGLGRRLHERMDAVVNQLHLAPYVQRRAGALSGGWKQRLALACALLHEPRVMFLDEPTAGIDPVARRELWDFLYELAGRGVTLFVTTHYMDEAERCNRLGYIYLSRMLLLGTPDELKADPRVTPGSARWYEAGLDGVEPPLEKLGKQDGISDVTVFGNTLHLLADSRVSQPQLSELAGGLEFREGAPTLEDVFVRLTRLAEQQRRQP